MLTEYRFCYRKPRLGGGLNVLSGDGWRQPRPLLSPSRVFYSFQPPPIFRHQASRRWCLFVLLVCIYLSGKSELVVQSPVSMTSSEAATIHMA